MAGDRANVAELTYRLTEKLAAMPEAEAKRVKSGLVNGQGHTHFIELILGLAKIVDEIEVGDPDLYDIIDWSDLMDAIAEMVLTYPPMTRADYEDGIRTIVTTQKATNEAGRIGG